MGGKERPRGPPRSGAPVRLQQSERPACGLRLSAAGLAGSAAHPPLRGRPQKRRRIRAVQNQWNIIEGISPRSGRTRTAPLHGATPAGCPAPGPVGQRASGKERGKSASGSAKRPRTLKERATRERVRPQKIPLIFRGALRGVPAEGVRRNRVAGLMAGEGFPHQTNRHSTPNSCRRSVAVQIH